MALTPLLLVAIGGALGAVLRHATHSWGNGLTVSSFPVGTLLVNILGCAAIGIVLALIAGPLAHLREPARLALVVGLLGGFTTFSTFAVDTIDLLSAGRTMHAAAYVLLSNMVGLLAAWGAWRASTMVIGPLST